MMSIDFSNLVNTIKSIDENFNNDDESNLVATKVFILGNTGSGKTSLSCSLSNKELLIVKEGNYARLKGEGVLSGSQSATREPQIAIDPENNIIYCDCPGFEDSEGSKQEIINSFSIEYLLKSRINDNKIIILIVASAHEIDSSRGKDIFNCMKRVFEMFSYDPNLQNGLGLVITKGDEIHQGKDYINTLLEMAPVQLKMWLNYIQETNFVFTFPKASLNNENTIYQFNEKENLISFIKNKGTFDLSHKLTLSRESKLLLMSYCNEYYNKTENIIDSVFASLTNKISEFTITEIDQLVEKMQNILVEKSDKVNDLINIYHNYFPIDEKIEMLLNESDDVISFDFFIDKVPEMNRITSMIHRCFHDRINNVMAKLQYSRNKKKDIEIEILKNQLINGYRSLISESNNSTKNKMTEMHHEIQDLKNKLNSQKNIENLFDTINNKMDQVIISSNDKKKDDNEQKQDDNGQNNDSKEQEQNNNGQNNNGQNNNGQNNDSKEQEQDNKKKKQNDEKSNPDKKTGGCLLI